MFLCLRIYLTFLTSYLLLFFQSFNDNWSSAWIYTYSFIRFMNWFFFLGNGTSKRLTLIYSINLIMLRLGFVFFSFPNKVIQSARIRFFLHLLWSLCVYLHSKVLCVNLSECFSMIVILLIVNVVIFILVSLKSLNKGRNNMRLFTRCGKKVGSYKKKMSLKSHHRNSYIFRVKIDCLILMHVNNSFRFNNFLQLLSTIFVIVYTISVICGAN